MRLYVNVDHVATIRQARRADEPDPAAAARLCEAAGADGITAHLREDRRHINDRDLETLAATVRTVLNAELALAPDASAARPAGTSRTGFWSPGRPGCERCSTRSWRWHPTSSRWSAGSGRTRPPW